MNKRSITASFKRYLKDQKLKEKDLTLASLPELFLAYYQTVPFETVGLENDGDMLLFQYGTYDWGQGEHFQINLTRQLIGMHDEEEEQEDHMYQLQVTLSYKPADFASVESFNKWSSDCSTLDEFKEIILTSAGYQAALNHLPVKLEIMTDTV